VSELRSVLDALATDDLHELSEGAVLQRVALLLAVQNQIAAELTRTVRHADTTQAAEHDGLKTMPSWLRGHGHLSHAEAARLVRAGRSRRTSPSPRLASSPLGHASARRPRMAVAVPGRVAAGAECPV
jgi:hypothetical protein